MARALAVWVVLVAGSASAQIARSAEVEHLYLDGAARGSLVVGNGQTMRGGTFRLNTALQYSYGHVKSGAGTLLRDRFALHLIGAVGITHWLEFSGDLPLVLHQTGEGTFAPNPGGMGTPFIHAKISILDTAAPVALWASVGLGLPVGSPGGLGNGGLAFMPRINLGRAFERVQFGLEVGALIRPVGSFADITGVSVPPRTDRVGSQLYLALAASSINAGFRGEVSLRTFASLIATSPGAELLFGGRYPYKELEFFFLGGPGLGTPTTPIIRLYAGVSFGNGGPPLKRCTETIPYPVDGCPDLDKDGDGVRNGVDGAPLLPEDKDGFQDEDGVPDPDNDLDEVLDGADACPNVKGLKENRGCPVEEPVELPPPEQPVEPVDPG